MGYLNPLEELPAMAKLRALPEAERKALRAEFQALRAACDALAHQAWSGKRRQPEEASFWRASATYSRHVAVGLLSPATSPPKRPQNSA